MLAILALDFARELGPEQQQATGLVHSATEGRIAFDALTCHSVTHAKWRIARKRRRYEAAVQADGDCFYAPCFSPFGIPYPSATWATPTHLTFAVHAAAIAAAKAATAATRTYCRRRMLDRFITDAIESAPLPVLRPD